MAHEKWIFVDPTKVPETQVRGHEFSAKMGYLVLYTFIAGSIPKIEHTFFLISDDNNKFVWVPALHCSVSGIYEGGPKGREL